MPQDGFLHFDAIAQTLVDVYFIMLFLMGSDHRYLMYSLQFRCDLCCDSEMLVANVLTETEALRTWSNPMSIAMSDGILHSDAIAQDPVKIYQLILLSTERYRRYRTYSLHSHYDFYCSIGMVVTESESYHREFGMRSRTWSNHSSSA